MVCLHLPIAFDGEIYELFHGDVHGHGHVACKLIGNVVRCMKRTS